MQQDYDYFLSSEVDKYAGKWIAIVDKKVICTGKKVKEVYDRAKEITNKRAFIAKIPKNALNVLTIF